MFAIIKRESHVCIGRCGYQRQPEFFLVRTVLRIYFIKRNCCGCAVFTASCGFGALREAFEQADALDKLEGFAIFTARFLPLTRNSGTYAGKTAWKVPSVYGETTVHHTAQANEECLEITINC